MEQNICVPYVIRVPRGNTKITGNYYKLISPINQTRYHLSFDYIGYFLNLIKLEKFNDTVIKINYKKNVIEFCAEIKDFLIFFSKKYNLKIVIFHPRTSSYYASSVWGFMFSSEKHRLMFELKYNSLKDKFIN